MFHGTRRRSGWYVRGPDARAGALPLSRGVDLLGMQEWQSAHAPKADRQFVGQCQRRFCTSRLCAQVPEYRGSASTRLRPEQRPGHPSDGELREADMEVNGKHFSWSREGRERDVLSLRALFVHELGHVLGLAWLLVGATLVGMLVTLCLGHGRVAPGGCPPGAPQ